jgi:hypothetical protein
MPLMLLLPIVRTAADFDDVDGDADSSKDAATLLLMLMMKCCC